ncbi:carbon-nitrogen hydrolase [Sporodiniella umbellata]|nr:carbon-nitrogen hydrolase [Sporodiniella umbellata]
MKDKIKRKVEEHWPILIVSIVSTFGFGYQAIPILSWFFCPVILWYLRYQDYRRIFIVYLTTSVFLPLCFLGSFKMDDTEPRFPNLILIFSMSFLTNLIPIVSFASDRYITKHTSCVWVRTFFFPCVWASLWFLNQRISNMGDYFNLTNALFHWPEIAQTASLGGRPLLDFWMAWFATVLLELSNYISSLRLIEEALPPSQPYWRIKHPVCLYVFTMLAVYIYGGIRINIPTGSFYQVSYPHYIPKSHSVGCVVGSMEPNIQLNHDIWFNKSAQVAEAGAKIVQWSEETAIVMNQEDELVFLNRAKEFALKYKVYLVVTYGLVNPVQRNRLVLFTKEGKKAIDYNKAHPVPGVELSVPGEQVIQWVDTEEFGRVGAAICFDYSFPHMIRQASKQKIDVMIQSSYTWGPIGTYLAQTNHIRAIENGFVLLRCASQGISGVYEPTVISSFQQKTPSMNVETHMFDFPVQKRVATLYGSIGDTVSYLFVTSALAISVWVVRKNYKTNNVVI